MNASHAQTNLADQAGGIGVTLSLGSSQSRSTTTQTSDTAAASTLGAGRDIRIEASGAGQNSDLTLQDTSSYQSKQQSAGVSVSLCIPPFCVGATPVSGSVSASNSRIESNYASVTEQSGLRAGDQGFDVKVKGDTDLKGGAITSTQQAIDEQRNRFETGGTLTLADIQNQAEYTAKSASVSLGAGTSFAGKLTPQGSSAGVGKDAGKAESMTLAAISDIAGNTAARTGDAEIGIRPIFDAEKVQREITAQVVITQSFGQQASQAVGDYVQDQRKTLQEQLRNAATDKDKAAIQEKIRELNNEERVMNMLIGAVTGMGGSIAIKESLSLAAEKMRDYTIEDSKRFAGVTDGKTELNNKSGESDGLRGDSTKTGGTRVDLDILCGADNKRCATNSDGSLKLNERGQVVFLPSEADGKTLAEFLETDEGKKAAGATGGIQGWKGTLFGVAYAAGSWQDRLIEAFGGTHDVIGGTASGLYDAQGNIKRGMSGTERTTYNVWSGVAILPSAPFAAAELLPPEVWQAVAIFLRAAK